MKYVKRSDVVHGWFYVQYFKKSGKISPLRIQTILVEAVNSAEAMEVLNAKYETETEWLNFLVCQGAHVVQMSDDQILRLPKSPPHNPST